MPEKPRRAARAATEAEAEAGMAAGGNEFMKQAQYGAETRIGLRNVLARMRMVYGSQAQLTV
ncbi:hypothetical protein [Paenibacillus vietnamensis]|uniref:hypothetical protein n=1 Tax=Paenibacillus vietnamensis TaxID=2590547 RepID=UPI001CD0A139|nr:hypothetical protein [Paenibacillus vietnamensis]